MKNNIENKTKPLSETTIANLSRKNLIGFSRWPNRIGPLETIRQDYQCQSRNCEALRQTQSGWFHTLNQKPGQQLPETDVLFRRPNH